MEPEPEATTEIAHLALSVGRVLRKRPLLGRAAKCFVLVR